MPPANVADQYRNRDLIMTRQTIRRRPGSTCRIALAALCLAFATNVCGAEYLGSADPALQALPFSEAVRTDGLLILSGQIPNLPGTTDVAPGGIEGQSHQVMKNIKAILERHGSSLEKVVKCTVMIDNMSDWPAFNDVYVQYFPGPKPARSAFGADGLAMGALLEVECWAEH
jgi:2-iminobutanoate/2-iminopropanoate deaminase